MASFKDEYIYRVSLALTAGVGAGAVIASSETVGSMGPAAVCIAAVVLMTVLAAAMLSISGTSRRNSPLLWTVLFFLLGLFCYSNRSVISTTVTERERLRGAGDALTEAIESIPFRDCNSNALILALLKGDRSRLDRQTVSDFRNAGAAHMLALSGMHLGIIYLILSRLLFFLGNTPPARKTRYVLITLLTLLYTLMCGTGASLVRAWLFIFLDCLSKLLERPQPPGQIYCVALLLHLVARPDSICEIGFQLSYLAMAGIVFIWPVLRTWMSSRIWDAMALSISCQMFIAPLTLLYFGTFPKYFLITNLVAAPLMSVVMAAGIAATAASSVGLDCPLLYSLCEKPVTLLCGLLGNIASM